MRQAAFAVIIKQDQVLLVRALTVPQFVDSWSFPGGLVEPGEQAAAGAVREVIEETGIICEVDSIISETDLPDKNLHVTIYTAQYISGDLQVDPWEIAEAKWCTITESLNLPLAYNSADILHQLNKS